MSATVEPTSKPRLFRSWCEPCQDGVNFGKAATQRWADKHNTDHHQDSADAEVLDGQEDALELLKEGGP